MVPIYEIELPGYAPTKFEELSGEVYYTEMGIPVPIEFRNSLPDFRILSWPIIDCLRLHFPDQRIGLRMICSEEYEGRDRDGLVKIIEKFGHDKYELRTSQNETRITEHGNVEIYILEIEVGKADGFMGEEQIAKTMHAFHIFSQRPQQVDLCVVYDLKALQQSSLSYVGQEEIGYYFKNRKNKNKGVKAILKINWTAI